MGYNRIYKFELEIKDFQNVLMPVGSLVLSAKEQNGKLCIWAEIDTRCEDREKSIAIVGTGNPIDFNIGNYSYYFVDTVVMSNGLVWHVYAFNS